VDVRLDGVGLVDAVDDVAVLVEEGV